MAIMPVLIPGQDKLDLGLYQSRFCQQAGRERTRLLVASPKVVFSRRRAVVHRGLGVPPKLEGPGFHTLVCNQKVIAGGLALLDLDWLLTI